MKFKALRALLLTISFCLILILVFLRYQNKLSMTSEGEKMCFKNLYFPTQTTPVQNSAICYFTKNTCLGCIYEIKGYSEILSRSYGVEIKFVTNAKSNYYEEVKKRIPTLISTSVDSIFCLQSKPLLFITNEHGQILKYLLVESENPGRTKEFLFSLPNLK
jgi:hypothetical protein